MPTEEEICSMFKVSRITVRKALDGLTNSGYIYKIQGKGSFVDTRKTDMQLNHLVGFSEEMRAIGLDPKTELIDVSTVFPSESAALELCIPRDQMVYQILRLRYADQVPMAVECVYMPFYRFAGIEKHDLTKSLYELLGNYYGCEVNRATQSIRAGVAPQREQKLLLIPPGSPVLMVRRTTYDTENLPFEYVESVYRGDKYVFSVNLNK